MLTLDKTPQLTLRKPSHMSKHMTSMQVYGALIRQTEIQTAISAGFIAAAVDLSHDCSMDADHSLVDQSIRQSVDAFVSEFWQACHAQILQHYNSGLYFHTGWIGFGMDLFLTVAGHGVGFWEHETGKPLSDWLENYGCEFYAYQDDKDILEGYECFIWQYGRR